jgi:hypothetical protein
MLISDVIMQMTVIATPVTTSNCHGSRNASSLLRNAQPNAPAAPTPRP